ncbi:MAG: DUF4421 domain-containing protein [Clostridium sp.]|nr:DUF4421 domain-containing protein [Prevotella sp.]MCM1428385.1 DUF4421 domain-containing protein [Clostridium sp.]MCM1474857.1 DUF4421 domain-containing protein [Muribaculaceae bacterium]
MKVLNILFGIIALTNFNLSAYSLMEEPPANFPEISPIIINHHIPKLKPDSCPEEVDTLRTINPLTQQQLDSAYRHDHDWWTLLKKGKLSMSDTTVIYPKFLKFCVGVYNWGDKFFNSYDTDYVESTGKRWKARLVNDNWVDSYSMRFYGKDMRMRMMSDIYCNVGAYIQYMAVSVGYSLNINHAVFGKPLDQKRLEAGFSCARFSLDFSYTANSGGSYIRTFGDYKNGKIFKSYFPGLDLHTLTIDLYYFFNNRKYSQGAAYGFAKFQKRSAGSFIIGLTYSTQNISMDFSTLNPKLQPYFKLDNYFLKLHYTDYCLLLGYGFNWVWNPHLLFNISVMPSIGINNTYEDSAEGAGVLLSLNAKGRMSLTYNNRQFFMGLQGKIDGHWYHSDKQSIFNSIENLSASVGFRF